MEVVGLRLGLGFRSILREKHVYDITLDPNSAWKARDEDTAWSGVLIGTLDCTTSYV